MTRPPIDLKNRQLAALLAWMVPGLGHFYQGRRGKGALYFVCILGLFGIGMGLGQGKIAFWRWVNPLQDSENFRLWYPAQFWVGLAAFPALVQATLLRYGMDPILGGYLAEPKMNVINALHSNAGRYVDIGVVYTCIAGLLNVLAIYDAYDGPAQVDEPEPESPAPDKKEPGPTVEPEL